MNPRPSEKGSNLRSIARAMPSSRHPWTTFGKRCRFRIPCRSGTQLIPPLICDCIRRNVAEQKRRRRGTRRADHNVGFPRESFEIGRNLPLHSIGFQLGGEPVQPSHVARAGRHASHLPRQTSSAASAHISGCSNNEQRRSVKVPDLLTAHPLDALDDEANGQRIA